MHLKSNAVYCQCENQHGFYILPEQKHQHLQVLMLQSPALQSEDMPELRAFPAWNFYGYFGPHPIIYSAWVDLHDDPY